MSVQMIELEEVTMVDVCDEALEAVVGLGGISFHGSCGWYCR
jgi:hypothetical protein